MSESSGDEDREILERLVGRSGTAHVQVVAHLAFSDMDAVLRVEVGFVAHACYGRSGAIKLPQLCEQLGGICSGRIRVDAEREILAAAEGKVNAVGAVVGVFVGTGSDV